MLAEHFGRLAPWRMSARACSRANAIGPERIVSDPIGVVDPMIGQQVHGYVISHKLAEGGMGAVYVATHPQLDTEKVVKTLLPVYAGQEALRDRFQREAKAIAQFDHKHIIKIDNYGQLPDGRLFLMMPYLQGQALDEMLRERRKQYPSTRGEIYPHLTLHILVQVCLALQHMHDHGIIHRDIKPANVFILFEPDNPYRVCLIDLGIAKNLQERERVTLTGSAMGTPMYMSVEQYQDAASATPQADIHAVAVMAWEMMTGGDYPWSEGTPQAIFDQKRAGAMPGPHPAIPEAVRAVLLDGFAPAAVQRYRSPREFINAFAAALPFLRGAPTGPQIVAKLAPGFVERLAPTEETLRKDNDGDSELLLWPPRAAAAAALPTRVPFRRPTADRLPANTPQPTPVMRVTTLSAAAGATTDARRAHARFRALTIALSGAVVGAIFVVVFVFGLRSRDNAVIQPAASTATTGSSPFTDANVPGESSRAHLSITADASLFPAIDTMQADTGHVDAGEPAATTLILDGGMPDAPRATPRHVPPARPRPTSSATTTKFNPDAVGGYGDE